MPSLAMYPLNPPTDSKEYEKIIRDYCGKIFGGNVFLFGRNGQRQYGVDVVSSNLSKTIGVQCKDYGDTVIKEKDVDDMVCLAETFKPSLDLFVIAIAQKTDANIQRYVMVKSQDRLLQNKFPVAVVYWEEVENYIKNDPIIFYKYYGFLGSAYGSLANREKVLITDINTLRLEFLNLYCRFNIRNVILSEPFMGFPCEFITNYDCFAIELNSLLNNACVLQETDTYQNIKTFFYELDEYVGYLGTLVEMSMNNVYIVVNPYIRNDREIYEVIVETVRASLMKKYLLASELKEF